MKQAIILFSMTTVCLGSLIFSPVLSAQSLHPTTTQNIPTHLSTYVVKLQAIPSSVTLGGSVIPAREVTLSAQLPGRVEKMAGVEGDEFSKDDVLLELNTEALQAQRRAAVAALSNTGASLRNANIQYQRELISPDSISKKAPGGMGLPFMLDQVMTEPMSEFILQSDPNLDRYATLQGYSTKIEQARHHYEQARSKIATLDAQLRDSQSIANFDGVITSKMVEVGDTVQPGQALLKYADVNHLQVRVEVPARLVTGLQIGQWLPAKLDVAGNMQVKVAQIFPIADPIRHTVTVKCDLPPAVRTGAGQYAQIEIHDISTAIQHQAMIPHSAILWRSSLPGVYVLENNRRQLRLLRLGQRHGNLVSVLSGLKGGEVIELNPHSNARSGWITPPKVSQ
jgi:multidrug efflux pump subunit AcrA (membrane-fusion protein)